MREQLNPTIVRDIAGIPPEITIDRTNRHRWLPLYELAKNMLEGRADCRSHEASGACGTCAKGTSQVCLNYAEYMDGEDLYRYELKRGQPAESKKPEPTLIHFVKSEQGVPNMLSREEISQQQAQQILIDNRIELDIADPRTAQQYVTELLVAIELNLTEQPTLQADMAL